MTIRFMTDSFLGGFGSAPERIHAINIRGASSAQKPQKWKSSFRYCKGKRTLLPQSLSFKPRRRHKRRRRYQWLRSGSERARREAALASPALRTSLKADAYFSAIDGSACPWGIHLQARIDSRRLS
jgi:hypothetical protein